MRDLKKCAICDNLLRGWGDSVAQGVCKHESFRRVPGAIGAFLLYVEKCPKEEGAMM